MPNNPVQIILNATDFLRAPDPGRMGQEKDFFDGREKEFRQHQEALLAKVDDIERQLRASPYGPAAYLRVQLRVEALAKSYRPNRWVFTDDLFPCVGADAVGTLYFRAPLTYLATLRQRIESAEVKVEIKIHRETQKPYKAPTRKRSEVGAIETFEIAPPETKRSFSTSAALSMLRSPQTVSGYSIELFETPADAVIADDPLGRGDLRKSLETVLLSLGPGARTYLAPPIGRTPVLELQLTVSDEPPLIENRVGLASAELPLAPPRAEADLSLKRHESALTRLADHPLVRTIRPPAQLHVEEAKPTQPAAAVFQIPSPAQGAIYPIVGVIDTGVAECLGEWVAGRFDFLSTDECDPTHGTNVAGLVAIGQTANSPAVAPEPSGCRIYDAPLYPKGRFLDAYPNGFTDFLEELEQAVAEAKEAHGVRVFNLSINATAEVESHRYSRYAARLDEIADKYGVVFVNSVGNLGGGDARSPWAGKPTAAIQYFASRTSSDTIFKPSESVRNVAVGAINPPGTSQIEGAPTVYTRRGPGLQVGVKPDVAAYGGTGGQRGGESSGLVSVGPSGMPAQVMGTSYSAPLVARTLAGLDASTGGHLSIEALRAMLLHHTSLPDVLASSRLRDLARQFVGFGRPASAAEMLETDDHQITLVFQSRLTVGERRPAILRFNFEWPASLVDAATGGCSGHARMTLVYNPPLDPAFGAEFVRVNLDASLRQHQATVRKDGKPSYTDQITPRYLPKTAGLGIPEKALIDHGLKWWPCKQYERTFDMHGTFSSWRLEVTSVVRAEATFPAEGVPFAVILTIADPKGAKPIFQEMRQHLQASPARAVDIRTVTRVRPRR